MSSTNTNTGPWSHSSWSDFSCPLHYKLKRIDKLPVTVHPNAQRGSRVHSSLEAYMKGESSTHESPSMSDKLIKIKNKPLIKVEKGWAFDKKWREVPYNSENAFVRMILDLSFAEDKKLIRVLDWKTGRIYPDKHAKQASLYLCGAMSKYPGYEVYQAEMWYLDQNKIRPYTKKKKQIKQERVWWNKEGKKIQKEVLFNPKPTQDNCKWCPFRTDKVLANGQPGTCDEWRRAL